MRMLRIKYIKGLFFKFLNNGMWYAQRRRGSKLWKSYRRWKRRGGLRRLRARRAPYRTMPRYKKYRRSSYNGSYRIKHVSFERLEVTDQGGFYIRVFNVPGKVENQFGNKVLDPDTATNFRAMLGSFQFYRIRKIKVDVTPVQDCAPGRYSHVTTQGGVTAETYGGYTPRARVFDWVVQTTTDFPTTSFGAVDFVSNIPSNKQRNSTSPFKRVFVPKVMKNMYPGGPWTMVSSPRLETSESYAVGGNSDHWGWGFCIPPFGYAKQANEGVPFMIFNIRYTLYIELSRYTPFPMGA